MNAILYRKAYLSFWYIDEAEICLKEFFPHYKHFKAVFTMDKSYVGTPKLDHIIVYSSAKCIVVSEDSAECIRVDNLHWYKAKDRETAIKALVLKIKLNQDVRVERDIGYYQVVRAMVIGTQTQILKEKYDV